MRAGVGVRFLPRRTHWNTTAVAIAAVVAAAACDGAVSEALLGRACGAGFRPRFEIVQRSLDQKMIDDRVHAPHVAAAQLALEQLLDRLERGELPRQSLLSAITSSAGLRWP